jgi:hypothetical protein
MKSIYLEKLLGSFRIEAATELNREWLPFDDHENRSAGGCDRREHAFFPSAQRHGIPAADADARASVTS